MLPKIKVRTLRDLLRTIRTARRKRTWLLAGAALLFLLILALPVATYLGFRQTPFGYGHNVKVFDFSRGSTMKSISRELEQSRIISSSMLFALYARLQGADARIKAGSYRFSDAMPPAEILRKLVAGEVYELRFSVPEGYSVYQIAELLNRRDIFSRTSFLRQCFSRPLIDELGIAAASVEGYLYPSTYTIKPNSDEADLIREMVARFQATFDERYAAAAEKAGLHRRQLLTLASMIEKEAVVPEERRLIASVFLNRLKKNMPLQSDPTAVYGVRAFAGKVSKQDIQRDTPYNTYRIKGLPPGPIGNPGDAAIEAVLSPAPTRYLYFVAKNDGSHHFSETLEEHNRAVRTYLKSGANGQALSSDQEPEIRSDRPVIRVGNHPQAPGK